MELVKAALAYWHVVRGERAVFDDQRTPRMGVFSAGIKRSRVHVALEKSPLLLGDVHGWRNRSEVSCARLCQAAGCPDLPPGCAGLGQALENAMVLRCAASVCIAFFAVRRASGVAGLRTSDVSVDKLKLKWSS